MKKLITVLALCLAGGALVFAQDADDKPEPKAPVSEDIRALQLAADLADYGYKNESASALIEAAEILSQVQVQPLGVEATTSGQPAQGGKAANSSGYTPEKLLADGKNMAKGDKTLTKRADDVKKSLKRGTRGAVGGPKYSSDFCYGNKGTTSYTCPFYAGQLAEVAVHSIDGCDLDLYVYDESNNLIEKDSSYSYDGYVSFWPRWTGNFVIVVKNCSRYDGCFELYTN